jgi:hypothetical protein
MLCSLVEIKHFTGESGSAFLQMSVNVYVAMWRHKYLRAPTKFCKGDVRCFLRGTN